MHAMHQTPNSSAPKAAAHAAHPVHMEMSVGSATFSSSQEPIKDEDSLCKGKKRKATSQAVQISPICQHEIENIQKTELPSSDGACQYVKDRLMEKITCMVCGEEGHYTCDCPMKDQEEKVICTLCNRVGHCHLWCCRQNVSENHACHRCGEKGHYSNKKLSHFGEKCSHNREISCSSCDTNHLLGDCPMGEITCFLCEGKHHVPAQCRLSPIVTIATQYHRESLRATLNQLMTETSSRTLTPVKPSGKLPHYDAVPKVANFSSSNGQGPSARKNPMGSEVPESDKTKGLLGSRPSPAIATEAAPHSVADEFLATLATATPQVLCARRQAMAANDKEQVSWLPQPTRNPNTGQHTVAATSMACRRRCPRKEPSGELELCDVTCYKKGHTSYTWHRNGYEFKKKRKKRRVNLEN